MTAPDSTQPPAARRLRARSRRRGARDAGPARGGAGGCRDPRARASTATPRRSRDAGRAALGRRPPDVPDGARVGVPRSRRATAPPLLAAVFAAQRATSSSPRRRAGRACAPSAASLSARGRRRLRRGAEPRALAARGAVLPGLRRAHRAPQRRLVAPLPVVRPRALPAHRSGGDRRDHERATIPTGCCSARTRCGARDRFSCFAGFVEAGESLEAAVAPRGARGGGRARSSTSATAARRRGRIRAR